jgi:hypothetical protein
MNKQELFTKKRILEAIRYVSEYRKQDTGYYIDDNKEIFVDKWHDEFDVIVDQLILYERKLNNEFS